MRLAQGGEQEKNKQTNGEELNAGAVKSSRPIETDLATHRADT